MGHGTDRDFAVSPDAQKIVYTVSYYSVQQNKSHTVLYLMDADGANPTLLTTTADNESEPASLRTDKESPS